MKIENDYLVFEEKDKLKMNKKITGHSFVGLIGFDNFKKPGDYLLEMHNVCKEDVDPKWLRRGDFAEAIIKRVYERDGHKPIGYDKQAIKYDNFQNNPVFGGIIDFELSEENTLIEVKSKSLDKYDFIVKNPPKAEIYQGMFYGYLKHYDSIIMEWVFFDKETEESVFKGEKPKTLMNLKKFTQTYLVNETELKQLTDQAKQVLIEFRITKKIPLSMISDKYLEKVKEIINVNKTL